MSTPVKPIVMRRGFRALHRNDGRWQYKIGRQYVILFSPSGNRQTVACQDIAEIGDWERAQWKHYDQITPSRINQWLDAHSSRPHQEMLDKGYLFHSGMQYFRNSDNEYVNYPIGHITGPFRSANDESGKPWHCSVNGANGWHKMSFASKDEVIDWAIKKQKEILDENHTSTDH